MLGGLVQVHVQYHRLGDAFHGQVAGDFQLAFARGFDLGALEGRVRVLGGIEPLVTGQVVIELVGQRAQPGQRQGHLYAGIGDLFSVVYQGAFGLAEVDAGVGKAEVVPAGEDVGVAGVDLVGDWRGKSGTGEGEQGGNEQGLAHGGTPGSGVELRTGMETEQRSRAGERGGVDHSIRAASSNDRRGERG